ncbi:MAG: DUF6429 family protein [Lachnospiraceae bacterium]|nr:DUF6429 family protein [Lachnospiraceae bacterium]
MSKISAEEAMRELTLVLMYLSRFSENDRFSKTENLSWKGYDFSVINQLANEDYIRQGKNPSRTKSVWITPEGVELAKELLEKYDISDWNN